MSIEINIKNYLKKQIKRIHYYDILCFVMIFVYTVIFSNHMLKKHYRFATFAWDLGIFDQSFYTTIYHGKLFYNTAELYLNPSGSYFASKFSPILFFLLPIYSINPTAETLLIIKTFILALGAFPLYLIGSYILKERKFGLMIALIYLLYPGLHSANNFDFQQQIFIPVLIFTLFYFFIKKRWHGYFLFFFMCLMITEHVAITLFLISIYYFLYRFNINSLDFRIILKKKENKYLLVSCVISLFWYFVARYERSLFPINRVFLEIYQASNTFEVLGFNKDVLQLPIFLITNPHKLIDAIIFDYNLKFLYLIFLLGPLMFISIKSGLFIVFILLIFPFIISNYKPYYMMGAHYSLYVLPIIFISYMEGLINSNISKKLFLNNMKRLDLRNVLISTFLITLFFSISLSPLSSISNTINKKTNLFWYAHPYSNMQYVNSLHQLINTIPKNSSVLAQNNIFPHISNRLNAYVIPTIKDESTQNYLEGYIDRLIDKSNYIILDTQAYDIWKNYLLEKITNNNTFSVYRVTWWAVLFKRNSKEPLQFIPNNKHESFKAYKDSLVYSGKVIEDSTSDSGYSAYSEKGVDNGTFLYGPYTPLPPGNYEVTFEIRASEFNDSLIATFDICDNWGNEILMRKNLYGREINTTEWTNITFPFYTNLFRKNLEYRIFTSGFANIYCENIIIEKKPNFSNKIFLPHVDLNVNSGKVIEDSTSDSGYSAYSEKGVDNGTFLYGPYTPLPPGNYEVTFEIRASEFNDSLIATFDICDNWGNEILMRKNLYGREINTTEWTNITMPFKLDRFRSNLEYRIFTSGLGNIYCKKLIIK